MQKVFHDPTAVQGDDALIRPLSDVYPAMSHWIYVDAASKGLLPAAARSRAIEALDAWLLASVSDPELELWSSMARLCRTRFAELISADAQNVWLSKSLAGALGDMTRLLDVERSGNLVICTALSHPGFASFWREFAWRRSLELREVPLHHAGFDAGAVRDLIDARTLMVALPAVSHDRGWRLPVAEIGDLCRDRGVFFLVDGTSSVGVLQIGVAKCGIDGLVVAAEGNALGISGLGFSFVADAGIKRGVSLRQRNAGFNGPAAGATSGGDRRRPFTHERCDDEAWNPVSLVIACEALDVLAGCGVARIEGHALALAERLRGALEKLGLPVERPRAAGQLSHVAAVGAPQAGPDGMVNDPDLRRLAEQLTAGRVRYAMRGGQLQFSFHLYNRLRDVMDVRRIAAQSLMP